METKLASRTDLETLLDLNRDYIRSVQESDVQRFDQILAEDFLCTNPDGSLVDRAGFLKQTAHDLHSRTGFVDGPLPHQKRAGGSSSRGRGRSAPSSPPTWAARPRRTPRSPSKRRCEAMPPGLVADAAAGYFPPFFSSARLSIARTRSAAARRCVRSTSQAGIIPPGSLCSS